MQGSAQFAQARPTLLALLATAFLLCLALLFSASGFLRLAARLLQRQRGLGQRIAAHLPALATSLARIRQPRIFLLTLLLSCLTWGSSVCFNLLLLGALGVQGLPLLVGVISITMLVEALPVASISGLGVIEGGWTFGLVTIAGLEPGRRRRDRLFPARLSGAGGSALRPGRLVCGYAACRGWRRSLESTVSLDCHSALQRGGVRPRPAPRFGGCARYVGLQQRSYRGR